MDPMDKFEMELSAFSRHVMTDVAKLGKAYAEVWMSSQLYQQLEGSTRSKMIKLMDDVTKLFVDLEETFVETELALSSRSSTGVPKPLSANRSRSAKSSSSTGKTTSSGATAATASRSKQPSSTEYYL